MVAGSFGKVIAAEMPPRSLAAVALAPGGNYRCDERRRQSLRVEGRVPLLSNREIGDPPIESRAGEPVTDTHDEASREDSEALS